MNENEFGTATPPEAPPPAGTATPPEAPPPAIARNTTFIISAISILITIASVAGLIWTSMQIVERWTLLRLMIVIITSVAFLLLVASAWLGAIKVAEADARMKQQKGTEQAAGEDVAIAFGEALASVYTSSESAGRLALGGSVHLWVAGILAAVDFINGGDVLR